MIVPIAGSQIRLGNFQASSDMIARWHVPSAACLTGRPTFSWDHWLAAPLLRPLVSCGWQSVPTLQMGRSLVNARINRRRVDVDGAELIEDALLVLDGHPRDLDGLLTKFWQRRLLAEEKEGSCLRLDGCVRSFGLYAKDGA